MRLENGQSYEAYVRPLTLPWGYTLARGSRHEPAISLSFSGRADPSEGGRPKRGDNPVVRRPGAQMPDLGVALPADEVEATLTALGSLRATHPCFLVCNVDLRDDDPPLEAERIPADVRSDFGARAP